MGIKKEIICFPADSDLVTRIEDYRFANRIGSRSEAIRRLIESSLASLKAPPGKKAQKPSNA
jgi:hypothetical protein